MQRTTHELLEEKIKVTQNEMILYERFKTIEDRQQNINGLNYNKNIIRKGRE